MGRNLAALVDEKHRLLRVSEIADARSRRGEHLLKERESRTLYRYLGKNEENPRGEKLIETKAARGTFSGD